ncbi:uncharacterized protein LAESUDRAFT_735893 [Laetiporus sulphureus 93-53]|uniref:Copper transporter n=1 Tax=Laetiporus sulphureus 93-53 TaxID=1314785 RepID=A0A165FCZ7_9APHY|nr:uncharacterized protein LAESUDRAFT_735893 [Laetiporus sulphureus 93-53]KZT08783.1 hypothetical protein LAESUDRAFT_735893 [Laetiporus sulphureus 93-53]
MEGWRDHLHFSFLGEHVLLPNLHVDSLWKFVIASILAIVVCATERLLTYAITKQWGPTSIRQSRMRTALWRAFLYWFVTFDRLMYMLIAMTFNVGLITVTVTTLSVGQFVIEYIEMPCNSTSDQENVNLKEPLLSSSQYDEHSSADSYPPPMPFPQRRARSKPHNIYIHPSDSNFVRAEAAVEQLGLPGTPPLTSASSWQANQARGATDVSG